jgi:hypothetical protein
MSKLKFCLRAQVGDGSLCQNLVNHVQLPSCGEEIVLRLLNYPTA